MTPAAAAKAKSVRATESGDQSSHRLTGLAIISVIPALFWTALLAVVGNAIGHALDPLALATIGAAIAAFLAAVVTALRED